MSNDTLDKLFDAMDSFEHAMATRSIKSRKGSIDGLNAIAAQVVTVLNRGTSFKPGVKSILLRIERLVNETVKAIANGDYGNLTEIRQVSANKLGPLNAMLRGQNAGVKATNDQKAQVREYEKDEDTQDEIAFLTDPANYNPGKTKIGQHEYVGQDIVDTVGSFLHWNFSKSQLNSLVRAIKEYKSHVEHRTPIDENVKEIAEYWNGLTLMDILAAAPKTPALREIVTALTKHHDDDLKDLAESYKSLAHRLPASLPAGTPFKAFYYPVVPIFKDFDASRSPAKLERAGFTVSKIGSHFMVLENQLLLCVDKHALESLYTKTVKGHTTKEIFGLYMQEVLDAINSRFPKKYALASYHVVPHPKNPNLGFVWLISEHARVALSQSLHSTQVDWDIPRYDMRAVQLSKQRETPAHRFTTREMPEHFRK